MCVCVSADGKNEERGGRRKKDRLTMNAIINELTIEGGKECRMEKEGKEKGLSGEWRVGEREGPN